MPANRICEMCHKSFDKCTCAAPETAMEHIILEQGDRIADLEESLRDADDAAREWIRGLEKANIRIKELESALREIATDTKSQHACAGIARKALDHREG